MAGKIWSSDTDVFQWGEFTEPESERLRAFFDAELHAVVRLDQDGSLSERTLNAAKGMLRALELHMHVGNEHLDTRLRFVVFFRKAANKNRLCNASVHRIHDDVAANSYVITINIEALPILHELLEKLLVALPPFLSNEFPGMHPLLRDSEIAADFCMILATEFIVFHEVGHMQRGHLEFILPSDLGQDLSEVERVLSRTLETDADIFAASILSAFVAAYAASPRLLGDEEKGESAWSLAAVLSSFAVFSVVSEAGSFAGTCYHFPMTRLHLVTHVFNVARGRQEGDRYLIVLAASLQKLAPTLIPEQHSSDVAALARDDEDLRGVTLVLRKSLEAQGKLRGWRRN